MGSSAPQEGPPKDDPDAYVLAKTRAARKSRQ